VGKGAQTAGAAFLDALVEAGIGYVFANFGSDHPAIVEAIAAARATGRPVPEIVTCPNEMVGMSAAHGYAQVSGRPQAVLVHVECGTQALAGAVHNAAKGRVPMLVFAGASPFTQGGELKGSRNEFIQWIQDVHDQRGIVRGYMKYDNEIRTGLNVKQLTHRALQIAMSDPRGPVYLMAAREVMEEEMPAPPPIEPAAWAPVPPLPLPEDAVATILAAFATAKRPLVVTSYLGRRAEAVPELVRFCEAVGAGVLESVPVAMNFPHDHPLYQGNQWNEPRQNPALAAADCILVVDSDVPWIPTVSRPAEGARIFHIDIDPLKEQMPLWYIGARLSLRDGAPADERGARWPAGRARGAARADRAPCRGERAPAGGARGARGEAGRADHARVRHRLRAAAPRRRHAGAERGDHQLRGGLRPSGDDPAGVDLRLGRRLARLERRRGDRRQARGAGEDRRRDDRRRVLHVLGAVERALDGGEIPHAVPAGRLQQSRLEGPAVLGARGAPGRLREPRQRHRHRLRSATGLCRHRRRRGRRAWRQSRAAGGGGADGR
jgi:hypothetical protein